MIIRDIKELKEFLSSRINESSLDDNTQKEMRTQQKVASQMNSLREEDEQSTEDSTTSDTEPSKTVVSDAGDVDPDAEINVEDIISQLNAVRSGKSLKDEIVKKNFVEYFDSLKKAEKVALKTFLKGISQVLTGEVSGEAAIAPHEPPVEVEMKKTHKIEITPTVISQGTPVKSSEKTGQVKPPIEPKSK